MYFFRSWLASAMEDGDCESPDLGQGRLLFIKIQSQPKYVATDGNVTWQFNQLLRAGVKRQMDLLESWPDSL